MMLKVLPTKLTRKHYILINLTFRRGSLGRPSLCVRVYIYDLQTVFAFMEVRLIAARLDIITGKCHWLQTLIKGSCKFIIRFVEWRALGSVQTPLSAV